MLKFIKKATLGIFLCLFISAGCDEPFVTAQINSDCNYDYPVKPGTEEWKKAWDKLGSYKAMLTICQVPDSILQCISTDNLMVLCLEYPFLLNMFAFNDLNYGIEDLFNNSNGIREFSKRGDAINKLAEQYVLELENFPAKLDNDLNNDSVLLIIGTSITNISALEALFTHSNFHNNISKENQKKILQHLLFGYKEKIKYSKYFKGHGFETNLFSRAHLIIKIDPSLKEKFDGTPVLYNGFTDSADLINTIDSLTYELIK